MKGATPSSWKMLAQGATRLQRNHASGRAMATDIAAAVTASRTEVMSALRHSGLRKISEYQASEKPFGGKERSCFWLTDTPATTMRGAARNSPTRNR